jgi:hypothetical protein
MQAVTKMTPPFLANFKSDKNKIVLIVENTHNLFKGVYLTGEYKGWESTGINSNFLEPFEGTISNEMIKSK